MDFYRYFPDFFWFYYASLKIDGFPGTHRTRSKGAPVILHYFAEYVFDMVCIDTKVQYRIWKCAKKVESNLAMCVMCYEDFLQLEKRVDITPPSELKPSHPIDNIERPVFLPPSYVVISCKYCCFYPEPEWQFRLNICTPQIGLVRMGWIEMDKDKTWSRVKCTYY